MPSKELYMDEMRELCKTYGFKTDNQLVIDVPYDLRTINKLNIKYGNKDIKFITLDPDTNINQNINNQNINNQNMNRRNINSQNMNSQYMNGNTEIKYIITPTYNYIVYYLLVLMIIMVVVIIIKMIRYIHPY
jgi:CO dehydrogenase/acetyl-CoA synthase gamma subunit (corrinoid Fe-S protein)